MGLRSLIIITILLLDTTQAENEALRLDTTQAENEALLLDTTQAENEVESIKGSASFRRLGYFSSKLSYGHIHTTFDFSELNLVELNLVETYPISLIIITILLLDTTQAENEALLLDTTQAENEVESIKGSASFRRLGYFSSKLSYGHIHTTFDFSELKRRHEDFTNYLEEETANASSKTGEEKPKEYYSMMKKQLEVSNQEILRIDELLFQGNSGHLQKRQLAGPIGLGFGLFGLGVSIYNTIEIRKLHTKIDAMEESNELIEHENKEEANTIAGSGTTSETPVWEV